MQFVVFLAIVPTTSGFSRIPYIPKRPLRFAIENYNPTLRSVVGDRWRKEGVVSGDVFNGDDEEDDERLANPNEPDWLKIFPKRSAGSDDSQLDEERLKYLESVDFSKLKPNDPIFLDMNWPTESGPISAAYSRHIQWKRKLTDFER